MMCASKPGACARSLAALRHDLLEDVHAEGEVRGGEHRAAAALDLRRDAGQLVVPARRPDDDGTPRRGDRADVRRRRAWGRELHGDVGPAEQLPW